jgi:hypothetical protein
MQSLHRYSSVVKDNLVSPGKKGGRTRQKERRGERTQLESSFSVAVEIYSAGKTSITNMFSSFPLLYNDVNHLILGNETVLGKSCQV